MRLKRLTLQAFGPFKDKVVIDFESDKIDKGLLLISGDTGSGKTTIFDAICYALYGEASGQDRESASLRSDWASPDIESYVNLEFYYKNKLYEVKRIPEYFKAKKNGEGFTKQSQKAEFEINGKKVTKAKAVTKELEDLIGLDYKQFRQVAMLSQGEFTKFLLADSKEKTSIFRKIFSTELYDRLQSELKEKMSSKKHENELVKEKLDAEKKNLKTIIDVFGLSDDETICRLDEKIKEDEVNVGKTKEERDKKLEEKTELFNELDNSKKLNENIFKYEEACKNLESLVSNNPKIDDEKEQYDYNIQIATPISKILTPLQKDSKLLGEKKEDCIKHNKCLETKRETYADKEEDFKELSTYSTKVEKLSNDINDLENTDKKYETYLNKVSELADVKETYKVKSEEYERQNSLYETMRKEYYLNVSVEIADTLVDGEACPVCGSKEHPKKAISNECEYTKEDLEKTENELKKLDGKRKKCEARIEEIRKIIDEYDIPEDLDVELEKEKNIKLLEEKKEEKEKLNNEFNKLSKEKQELFTSIKSLEDRMEIIQKDIKKLEESIEEYNIQLENLYNENGTNYEDYLSKKLDEEDLSKLNEKIEDFNKKKTEFESTINLLKDEVEGKEVIDVSGMEKQLNSVTGEYEELDALFTDLSSKLVQLKTSTDNIKEYMGDSKKIQKEFGVIKLLSDTANGNLSGKQKITFENFVQAYFMQTVLVEANNRLIKMTDSRYELKKKEMEIKKSGKTGLEFSIFDSYTGKERDVSSLSGGEKFKASLALALGLSDVISNKSGGIKIESLFIDEGFGSLDSDSLNQALNILYDLSGNHKLIGVISHVSELKNQIDNKILVKKTNAGSEISIESNY